MNCFQRQIAANYRNTRYIPGIIAAKLIRQALRHSLRETHEVADVGCGTGRFTGALANSPGVTSVHGYDISSDMLAQVSPYNKYPAPVRLMIRDCSKRGVLQPESFDLIFLHWVLNTSVLWREIVDNCVRAVRAGGLIVWLDENGSLYRSIDGDSSDFVNGESDFISGFFEEFYRTLGYWGRPEVLREREGIQIGGGNGATAIAARGFKIKKLNVTAVWNRQISVDWLYGSVLKAKAFSNFHRIPDSSYSKALTKLGCWIARYPTDARKLVWLQYSASPVIAVRL